MKLPISHLIKKFPFQFIMSCIFGVLYNSLIAVSVVRLGKVIDAAVTQDFKEIVYMTAIYLAVIFISQSSRYLKRYYTYSLENLIEMDLKHSVFTGIIRKDASSLESGTVGDLMSRTTVDVRRVVAAISKTFVEVFDTWVLLASYFISLLVLDLKITLISSISIPFAILAAELVRHPLYKYSREYSESSGKIGTQLQQTLTAIPVLRLFGVEDIKRDELNGLCVKQTKAGFKIVLFESGMEPVYIGIASLGVIVIILMGGHEVVYNGWAIGSFWSFLTIFTAMAARTRTAARVFNTWHMAGAAWERLSGHVDYTEFKQDKRSRLAHPQAAALEAGGFPGLDEKPKTAEITAVDLDVRGLSYKYPLGNTYVLRDISFKLRQNEILGITGPIGSGKSALCLALTGLYEYEGSARYNGKELRSLDEAVRSGIVSYLGHEQYLFSASIKDNICIDLSSGKASVNEALLKEAVEISCLEHDLSLMPDNINTIVGERGVKVSGGQRQRIALARAIYLNKPLLLLDDPFSALDIVTERRIIENLKRLKGKSIIIFSHRLEAFCNASEVIVLKDGKVSERGTHEALMADAGSMYKSIYDAQEVKR